MLIQTRLHEADKCVNIHTKYKNLCNFHIEIAILVLGVKRMAVLTDFLSVDYTSLVSLQDLYLMGIFTGQHIFVHVCAPAQSTCLPLAVCAGTVGISSYS